MLKVLRKFSLLSSENALGFDHGVGSVLGYLFGRIRVCLLVAVLGSCC